MKKMYIVIYIILIIVIIPCINNVSAEVYAPYNSPVFHEKGCSDLPPNERLMTFASIQSALNSGGSPCDSCIGHGSGNTSSYQSPQPNSSIKSQITNTGKSFGSSQSSDSSTVGICHAADCRYPKFRDHLCATHWSEIEGIENKSVADNDIKMNAYVLPKTNAPKFVNSDTMKGLLAVIGIIWLGIVIFGCYKSFQDEVIFFDNFMDLFIASSPIWILIVSAIVMMFSGESVVGEIAKIVILYTCKYGLILSGGYNLVVPFIHNRSTPILALCVMAGRQLLVVVVPVLMFFVMVFGYGDVQRRGESNDMFGLRNELAKLRALAILAGLAFFMIKLINGDRVRELRPKNHEKQRYKGDYSNTSRDEKNGNQFNEYDDSKFDPYKVLGISRTGSIDVEKVKKAYHNLSSQYHPDKVAHLGEDLKKVATAKMKIINKAYECLMNAESSV